VKAVQVTITPLISRDALVIDKTDIIFILKRIICATVMPVVYTTPAFLALN